MRDSQKQILQILVLGGFVLFGLSRCNPIGSARQCMTQSFEPVVGTVVRVDSGDINPSVDYRYSLAGQAYCSDRFSYVTTDTYFEFDTVIGGKQPGDAINVFVDPEHPERSVLQRGLSSSALFCLVWLAGVSFGFIAFAFRFVKSRQSRIEREHKLAQRADFEDGVMRLRLVPGNFTPVSAGVACFVAVTALTFGGLAIIEWGTAWWSSSLATRAVVSLVIGTAAGVFDYRYTLTGNRRGRWDLIIDVNRGYVQLPAVGAYGEPTNVKLDHAVGVTVETYLAPCEEQEGIYRLKLDCYEEYGLRDAEMSGPVRRRWHHLMAQGSDRVELEAMADFLRGALGLSRHDAVGSHSDDSIELLSPLA